MEAYELIRSRRRTLALEVTADGRLLVRAPLRCAQGRIDAFVTAHAAWIERHLKLQREKAAFSDAVGHSLVDDLKSLAERTYGEDWEKRAEAYAYHAKPFTKESLLYREIFEKHYPGQAEIVADFWMPNRAWEGCDVNDPSARVLSNYGASGE